MNIQYKLESETSNKNLINNYGERNAIRALKSTDKRAKEILLLCKKV